MKTVTFSGIDGSGKSTQIKLFKKYLEKKGINVKLIHIIQNSTANRIAAFFKKFSGKKNKSKKSDKCLTSDREKLCIFSVTLRKFFLLLDLILFRFFLLSQKGKKGVIICDRYFYDYLINIYYLEDNLDPHLAPLLQDLIPKPNLGIYLKVDPEIANKRKNDQGMDYLKAKTMIFEKLKDDFSLNEVNSKDGKITKTNKKIIELYEGI